MSQDQTLACDLAAIPAAAREEHLITTLQLFGTAQDVQELPDGFAIRFINEPGKLTELAKFIENERLCCPFFNFSVDVDAQRGPLWLRLTGGKGVKELLHVILFAGDTEKHTREQKI